MYSPLISIDEEFSKRFDMKVTITAIAKQVVLAAKQDSVGLIDPDLMHEIYDKAVCMNVIKPVKVNHPINKLCKV